MKVRQLGLSARPFLGFNYPQRQPVLVSAEMYSTTPVQGQSGKTCTPPLLFITVLGRIILHRF
jgi:hypothetical protein